MPLFAHWRHARVSSGAKGGWQGTFNKASAEKIDLSTTLTIKIQKIENGDDVIITDENQKKKCQTKKFQTKKWKLLLPQSHFFVIII